ncbi:hypothetical protein Asera_16050 [Actinocatenispora sera]|uniref:Uncharacterized protein n=2 Tax=Actinocatenispora sera TaxID=390989 RepID=A0A810KX55_9ACTN|nr:hypothetical protein Asera_16050 [Actinocatenispora sera]
MIRGPGRLGRAVAVSRRVRWQVGRSVMGSVPVRVWMRATYRSGKTVASMRYGLPQRGVVAVRRSGGRTGFARRPAGRSGMARPAVGRPAGPVAGAGRSARPAGQRSVRQQVRRSAMADDALRQVRTALQGKVGNGDGLALVRSWMSSVRSAADEVASVQRKLSVAEDEFLDRPVAQSRAWLDRLNDNLDHLARKLSAGQ